MNCQRCRRDHTMSFWPSAIALPRFGRARGAQYLGMVQLLFFKCHSHTINAPGGPHGSCSDDRRRRFVIIERGLVVDGIDVGFFVGASTRGRRRRWRLAVAAFARSCVCACTATARAVVVIIVVFVDRWRRTAPGPIPTAAATAAATAGTTRRCYTGCWRQT